MRFQSTLSSRRATQGALELVQPIVISIHALLTESDLSKAGNDAEGHLNFNPRSPHGERHVGFGGIIKAKQFQSTLSSRRATWVQFLSTPRTAISIHALLTESDFTPPRIAWALVFISIHALLTESDRWFCSAACLIDISIHALLTESDAFCAGDVVIVGISIHALLTESDEAGTDSHAFGNISIHALLTESDRLTFGSVPTRENFNPRSPHGERLRALLILASFALISIHALLTESDLLSHLHLRTVFPHFNPRSPHGERRFLRCW